MCTDCHGSHEILGAADAKSSIFKFNVPKTCGTCHGSVEREFDQSTHGQAILRGQWQAPVCTDCHGIHSIQSHKDPTSPVSAQNLAEGTCARCHEGVRLSREFGFEAGRVSTYMASYHGLASQRGSTVVANCASCHGVHNILPSSDPHSTVSPANLVKTCGQCHVGATQSFVAARVHVNAPLSTDKGSSAVRWVKRIYIGLIIFVIASMLAHNGIVWRYKALARRRQQGGRTVVRMTRSQRIQHNVLFVSFTVLVITGFGLKYPDSWWSYLLLGISESTRGIVHRISGVVLIVVGFYHAGYAVFTREGRSMLRQIWLRWSDASDFGGNVRYHLGLQATKPTFGRFTYAEKVEYWALIWGTILMAVTGIMLWAKVLVGNHLPRWWLDVATAVHFYEAVLATLAILVWHFYQVFFDPDAYPMNWAWWDGQVPLAHYQAEHPLDLEAVRETGRPPRFPSNRRLKPTVGKPRNRRKMMAVDDPTPKKERLTVRLQRQLRNPISMAGVALAIVSSANIFLFFLIDLIADRPSPYIGILAYMVAPGFLICGFSLIAVGAWRERHKKVSESRRRASRVSPHRSQRSQAAQRTAFFRNIPGGFHDAERGGQL